MDYNRCFTNLNVGLPEDIARFAAAGFYEEAIALIDMRLEENWGARQNSCAYQGIAPSGEVIAQNPMPTLPKAMRDALIAQREMLTLLPQDYTYSKADVLAILQEKIPDATAQEVESLFLENRLDWRFVNGEIKIAKRFYASLIDTDASYAQRAGTPHTGERVMLRDAAIATMQTKGYMRARITLHASIKADDTVFAQALAQAKAQGKDTVTVKAWLPIAAACQTQGDIVLQEATHEPTLVAPQNAPARTVYFEKECAENETFAITYAYTQSAPYHDLRVGGVCAQKAMAESQEEQVCYENDPMFAEFLAEEAPHLVFTPFLSALVAELTEGITSPLEKARKIYDYITLNVHYRYMPPYFMLENIADQCALSRRGDCGVMAATFVTMCRIAGIPAQWESGLMVNPTQAGCHDWARFYIAPLGWLYADCSYGSSAAREEAEVRRTHYFGNLEAYRMVANRQFQARLTPAKTGWRADPYDNQSGELSLGEAGLHGYQVDNDVQVVSFVELD